MEIIKNLVGFKGHDSPPPKNPRQKCRGFFYVYYVDKKGNIFKLVVLYSKIYLYEIMRKYGGNGEYRD